MKELIKEARRMQQLAGILKEGNASTTLGDMIDQMQDNEEGIGQGLKPSQLIDYNLVGKEGMKLGINLDLQKLKQLAKANDSGFLYSGEDMVNMSITNKAKTNETSDPVRDAIDSWYWSTNPRIDELSPEQIEQAIQDHYEEWIASKHAYNNDIQDYFEDVEEKGHWY